MTTTLIELKIGASLNMPTKRMKQLLSEVAADCNVARNKVIREWERWAEDHPDYEPQPRVARGGAIKTNDKGEPIMEKAWMPQSLERRLYHAAREAAPKLNSNLATHVRAQAVDKLASRVPYNHGGESKYAWEAILKYERARPCFRAVDIPAPNKDTVLCYEGFTSREMSSGVDAEIVKYGTGSAVLRFALLSRDAGAKVLAPVARIEVRQNTAGNRRILKRIARRELKMSDSRIVEKDGNWFFQMSYKCPPAELGLNPERVATLWPQPDSKRSPFQVDFAGDSRWYVGSGEAFRREHEHLVVRRKTIRHRYKHSVGKGHGKGRVFAKLRPYERSFKHMQDRFTKELMAEIIKGCIRHDCGTLEYREPTMPLRDGAKGKRQNIWFAGHGIPFNWSTFLPLLKHKCELNGIAMPKKTVRLPVGEWRERYPDLD